MKLIDVTRSAEWEQFQTAQPFAQFLQSWAWGEFRLAQREAVLRLALVDERGTWLCAVQLERRTRRFGMGYWFASRGPVFSSVLAPEKRRDVMQKLCELLNMRHELRDKTLFWRMEPAVEATGVPIMPSSFRRAHALNPSSTVLLDLSPSTDDLLSAMHEKTRYNIRLAERKGVTVRVASSPEDVEAFLILMDETAKRDGFVQHSRAYLKSTYDFLSERGLARIRLAEWDGKILSANFEVLYGDTVTYLYGTSSSEDRNVMAPFLLHWEAIQSAKQDGYGLYDFWGANPPDKEMPDYKASWEGISRFKNGWGGRLMSLAGTFDLPLKKLLYKLIFLK